MILQRQGDSNSMCRQDRTDGTGGNEGGNEGGNDGGKGDGNESRNEGGMQETGGEAQRVSIRYVITLAKVRPQFKL